MLRPLFVLAGLLAAPLAAPQAPLIVPVTVALCDNKYQGIVPVPASIGNGQDAGTNLYWGFAPLLERAGSSPLLLTNGLMAPEAYSLRGAIEAWERTGDEAQVREAAALAYARHQSRGIKGARRLFASR